MTWKDWTELFESTTDQPLSADMRILLDEANKLLQLKAELGRMPASRFRAHLMQTIDQWFDVDSSRKANHAEHQRDGRQGSQTSSVPKP